MAGLAACGGGGGSPGSTVGGGSTDGGATPVDVPLSADPILLGTLTDATGVVTNSISASGFTLVRLTLTDPSGRGIPNQVIAASGDSTKIIFPEGASGLTNASGIATIKVARASLFATGADSLTITYSYKAGSLVAYPNGSAPPSIDTVVSQYVGYQLSAANVTLTNLNVGTQALAAYGTRQISVQVNIDGAAATSTPVQVSFSSNCGVVTPATASTNSQGVVNASYSAVNSGITNDQGCSDSTVSIVASTTGVTPVTGNIRVELAPATNLLFANASPANIYLANSGGVTQSIVKFKLVNASNAALQGQDVRLELRDMADGIPKATFGTVGNVSAITQPTNSSGEVSVPVFSGTVPTNVIVRATLVSDEGISTTSAVLAIASGRAVQSRVSVAVEKLSIEGANIDGVTTSITISLADRQGNPIPDGTAINFVTEGGVMIPPVCVTGVVPGDSRCSVSIRSQGLRPGDGLVSILAYASGEEDFRDLNFDNVYSVGEPFTDLGNAFRQDAALAGGLSGPFVDGYFAVPREGAASCSQVIPGQSNFLGRPGSCDAVWGAADVRQQAVVVFATSRAAIAASSMVAGLPIANSNPLTNALPEVTVLVADENGNSMPTGTKIDFSTIDDGVSVPGFIGATCSLTGTASYRIDNTIFPSPFVVSLASCIAGDKLQVRVTSPLGTVTERAFTVTN